MFIFIRVLLAHFLADFALQFTVIYRLKTRHLGGGLVHGSVVALTMVLLCWPFWDRDLFWGCMLVVAVTHTAIDQAKVMLEARRPNTNPAVAFFGDQLLHVGVIALVFLTPLARITPVAFVESPLRLYFSDGFIYAVMGYVVSMMGGTIVIYTLHRTFPNPALPEPRITFTEKYFGTLERACITTFVIMPGKYYFLVPVISFFRGAFVVHSRDKETIFHESSLIDMLASALWALLCGLVMKELGVSKYLFGSWTGL
jgi:hypothetical protein